MSSKYYEWLAKDQKKEEKRELTPKEKRINWWHYHKWYVVAALVLGVCVVSLIGTTVRNYRSRPDYSVAYIGSAPLAEETSAALQAALEGLGRDLNGNGEVSVAVRQYILYAGEDSDSAAGREIQLSYDYTGKVQLMADFESCDSFFFLMEEPERFQSDYGVLARLDGSLPEETPESSLPAYLPLKEFPALEEIPGGQSLYLARRGFVGNKVCENLAECEALWAELLENGS